MGGDPDSGTSYAAPLVTGIIALMLAEANARGGQLSTADIKEILASAVVPMAGSGGWTEADGPGRLDAAAALRAVIARFP